jgi:hypothetical protein
VALLVYCLAFAAALLFSFFGSLAIFILALLRISFTAFYASALVWNASSSSIHGKLSSIFLHAEYIYVHNLRLVQEYFQA